MLTELTADPATPESGAPPQSVLAPYKDSDSYAEDMGYPQEKPCQTWWN